MDDGRAGTHRFPRLLSLLEVADGVPWPADRGHVDEGAKMGDDRRFKRAALLEQEEAHVGALVVAGQLLVAREAVLGAVEVEPIEQRVVEDVAARRRGAHPVEPVG